ncbi:PAS domain-containing sensor histidine kinase [Flavobacterium silvaticum]|uniref:histidine kinase n=1 Tax=Flavobacterium silvaticum TaxID=1852020 RepID=A0A972FJZ6_9FLAO|nr:PAS domain S-box protein [Flavobacterium silvaticum]NMH27376.1 PAS domain S-box protein [Flavobacterium silvaticum]
MSTAIPIDDHFRIIADTAPVLIWLSDADGTCVYLNKEWLTFTGKTLEEQLQNGWQESIHPDDILLVTETFLSVFEKRQVFEMEFRLRRHDGIYRYVKSKGVPHYGKEGQFKGYSGSCMDIQDRYETNEILEKKVTERTEELRLKAEELRKQKDFSEKVINASVDIMIVYDNQMNFISMNKAARKLYGLGTEIIGKNLFDIFPQVRNSPGHLDTLRALSGETVHNPVYKSAVTEAWFEDFIIPLLDENEKIYGVLVVARDITQRIRKEEELKSLNHKLIDRNNELQSSNEDLASFNYVASHDLQEPLRKVNIFASRILENEKDTLSDQSLQYFDRISSAIARMQNLIMALLEYSRTESEEVKRVKTNLNRPLKEAIAGLDEAIRTSNANIEWDDLPMLNVIPLQIQQLFHNLISNSLKYAKPDVAPHISISATELELPERDNQPFWKIMVTDNGIGFDMEYRQKIFELFQRLHGKTKIEGTGVGLAICRKIANNHNGFITAESELGKGSTFSVYLPAKI